MTLFLTRKLLRDALIPVAIVMLLVGVFEGLWTRTAQRATTELVPLFRMMAGAGNVAFEDLKNQVFRGPAKMMQTMMGGEDVSFDDPMDLLVMGYLHPLVQLVLCLWAVYRAGSAVSGEIDRGTMELLLSQPMPRDRLIVAHLLVDVVTIPLLCAALWVGTYVGLALVGPFVVDYNAIKIPTPIPIAPKPIQVLTVDAMQLLPGLWNVAALVFAVSGLTMWLSARGRNRWTVIGIAAAGIIAMFALNLIGQMVEDMAFLRPFTIFYYYQPQQMVLKDVWSVNVGAAYGGSLHLNMLVVLFGLGAVGYAMALRTFVRRDIPAPL